MSNEIDDYDYQRYAILFVDDEANTRKYFRRLFSDKFRILEAEDGVQALEIFRKHANEIGIIVTDQRMPNQTGVEFLSKIAGDHPNIIKILSTAYSDIDAAIGSVNEGGIFRYMTKPWDIPQLEVTLRRAMEFFTVKRERDALLEAKVQAMGNVLTSCRLSAFALIPVCAAIPCKHAAEAIASFVRTGISGDSGNDDKDLRTPNWNDLHQRQLTLAKSLESALPDALKTESLEERAKQLEQQLINAGAQEVTTETGSGSITIAAKTDPTPALLQVILGHGDGITPNQAIDVLAAYMAVHDAGGRIKRNRGEGLILSISTTPRPDAKEATGSEVAKWLIDDDMLISAALGLICFAARLDYDPRHEAIAA